MVTTGTAEELDRASRFADTPREVRGLNIPTRQLRPGDLFVQTYLEKVNGIAVRVQRKISVVDKEPGTILLRGQPLPAWSVKGVDAETDKPVCLMATDGARWDITRKK
jgi:hypothetical protein